jgi:glycosyltransferase involved in cell wall biosynthesis
VNTDPIRLLFCVSADADNVNAQSLNARDIALRLDPQRFTSTFFVWRTPDPRLAGRTTIRFVRIPPRLGSLVIAAQMLWGDEDIVFYPPHGRALTFYQTFKRLGKPKKIIATVEGIAQQLAELTEPQRSQNIQTLRQANACYAISPYIAETMRETFGLEMDVIPIGVDTRWFAPCDRTNHQPPMQVLCIGSLQPRKQIHHLLDLAEQIPATQAEFHIIGDVIGTPDYRDGLLKRKADEKLDHVFFHGQQSQLQVKAWLQRADVFVLPSRLEGTPKVVMEAAATGLPCIIFDDYHTPSVVDGVTGFQVKTFDEMLAKLKLLIENRELRLQMGAAAVKHIQQFDWDRVAKQWAEVLEGVAHADS